MKVVVNLPTTDDEISFLKNRIATFRATLILESINRLKLDNKEKKLILDNIISEIKKLNSNLQK